jgi:hypothetical protein
MTPGRLYLFAILCLVLAGSLTFFGPDTLLASGLAMVVTLLALVAYLFGIYLNRLASRGEGALDDLRSRIAAVTGQEITAEFRVYHREGLEGVAGGELLLFYRTQTGWLLVPLLSELCWITVPIAGLGRMRLLDPEPGEGYLLEVEMNTVDGHTLLIKSGSTLHAPEEQSPSNITDLLQLEEALRRSVPA